MSRPAPLLALLAVALVAATLWTSLAGGRFETVTGNLLSPPDVAADAAGWIVVGDPPASAIAGAGVSFVLAEPGVAMLEREIARPPGIAHVRFAAEVRTAGIVRGTRPWHGARVLLVQHDGAGRALWERPHQLPMADAGEAWQSLQARFFLPAPSARLRIVVGLNQAAGRLDLRGLSLVALVERPLFVWLRRAVAAAWLGLGLLAVAAVLRAGAGVRGVAVLLVAGGILAGGLLPHSVKGELTELARDWRAQLTTALPAADAPAERPADTPPAVREGAGPLGFFWMVMHKSGHVVLFALLTLAARWCWPRLDWRLAAAFLAVFALAAETLQQLTPDRLAHPRDVGFNLAGVVLGLLLAAAIARWRRRHVPPSVRR